MFDTYDRQLRRHARLSAVTVLPLDVLDPFHPDEEGRLDDVTRPEARSRGLVFYTSTRLSVLDKIFQTKCGHAVVLRYANNSLTRGEMKLAKQMHASRRQLAAGEAA